MKKNFFSGTSVTIYTFLLIFPLYFWFQGKMYGQENAEKEEIVDASPEKAAESAEKKQSLEELLAVPFNQIKSEKEAELEADGDAEPDKKNIPKDGDVKLPPPPEQRKVERDLEKQIDDIFREELPKEYVGVSVSIRYILETAPVTKRIMST